MTLSQAAIAEALSGAVENAPALAANLLQQKFRSWGAILQFSAPDLAKVLNVPAGVAGEIRAVAEQRMSCVA